MPLNKKGQKIKKAMRVTYKSKKKADRIFWASVNAKKIKGIDNG